MRVRKHWLLALFAGSLSCASAPPPRITSYGGSPRGPSPLPAGETDYSSSCGETLGTSHFPPPGDEDQWLLRERRALGLQLSAERNCKGPPGEITLLVNEKPNGSVHVEGTFGGSARDCDLVRCITASVESYQSAHPNPDARNLALPIRVPGDGTLVFDEALPWPEKAEPACELRKADPDRLGHMPKKSVQELVRSHFDTFQGCYRQGLKRQRELAGDVTVRFLIGHDGKVTHAGLERLTLRDCDVAECIVDDLEKIMFPPPEHGVVTMIYPIHFEPE
ncbi:MAG TPA: AgmX/PglI C-terminal domain-containing protein [Polyangiaceae bacterium]|nr:AgmX/PglI C-terminal domain-containing protein [Polyangiaceae bacterium]